MQNVFISVIVFLLILVISVIGIQTADINHETDLIRRRTDLIKHRTDRKIRENDRLAVENTLLAQQITQLRNRRKKREDARRLRRLQRELKTGVTIDEVNTQYQIMLEHTPWPRRSKPKVHFADNLVEYSD